MNICRYILLLGIFHLINSSVQGDEESTLEGLKLQLNGSLEMIEKLQLELKDSRKRILDLEQIQNQMGGHASTEKGLTNGLQNLGEVNERLDYLEEHITDLDDRVGSKTLVHAFDALSLNLGGFITQTGTFVDGEGSSEFSFNQTFVEILISAELNEDWSFFSALGYLREADLNFFGDDPAVKNTKKPFFEDFANRTPLIIAWANYRHSDEFAVQFGRYITPHGIINIEHFPPALLEINQPQFLRPFPGSTLFPNFLNGVKFHGKKFFAENYLDYNVYSGVFVADDADDLVSGTRVGFNFDRSGIKLGFNYSHGSRSKSGATAASFSPESYSISPTRSLTNNSYDTIGLDFLLNKGKLNWKNEIFQSYEYSTDNRTAFYTQPAFKLNDRWILFYRYDFLDPGQSLDKAVEHVFGFNYLPIPIIRLRGAYFHKEFDKAHTEVDILQFSATVSF